MSKKTISQLQYQLTNDLQKSKSFIHCICCDLYFLDPVTFLDHRCAVSSTSPYKTDDK
jgi:hypothetical protein